MTAPDWAEWAATGVSLAGFGFGLHAQYDAYDQGVSDGADMCVCVVEAAQAGTDRDVCAEALVQAKREYFDAGD